MLFLKEVRLWFAIIRLEIYGILLFEKTCKQ